MNLISNGEEGEEDEKGHFLFFVCLFIKVLDMSSVSFKRPLACHAAPARCFVCPRSALCETSGIEE